MIEKQLIADISRFEQRNVTFYPGSSWLYFKLYTNQGAIDTLLINIVGNIIKEFNAATNRSVSYFFLRYSDPAHHLRIRFRVNSSFEIALLIDLINKVASATAIINKVVIDTYLREAERYGSGGIDLIEKLFCADSSLVLAILNRKPDHMINDLERFSAVIFGIEHYLDAFGMSTVEKLDFSRTARDNFFAEFNADSILRKKLNLKFKELSLFIDGEEEGPSISGLLLEERAALCKQISFNIAELPERYNIMWSIIHMHVNRLFNRNQRFYELMVYDFLEKYYRKKIGFSKWQSEKIQKN